MDHYNPARPALKLTNEFLRWNSESRVQRQALAVPGPKRRALRASARVTPAGVRSSRFFAARVALALAGMQAGSIALFIVYGAPLWPSQIALGLAALTSASVVAFGVVLIPAIHIALNPRDAHAKYLRRTRRAGR